MKTLEYGKKTNIQTLKTLSSFLGHNFFRITIEKKSIFNKKTVRNAKANKLRCFAQKALQPYFKRGRKS